MIKKNVRIFDGTRNLESVELGWSQGGVKKRADNRWEEEGGQQVRKAWHGHRREHKSKVDHIIHMNECMFPSIGNSLRILLSLRWFFCIFLISDKNCFAQCSWGAIFACLLIRWLVQGSRFRMRIERQGAQILSSRLSCFFFQVKILENKYVNMKVSFFVCTSLPLWTTQLSIEILLG